MLLSKIGAEGALSCSSAPVAVHWGSAVGVSGTAEGRGARQGTAGVERQAVKMRVEDLLGSAEKQIGAELREAVSRLIQGCEALDMDLAFSLFWDSPGFRMIAADGSLCDYRTYVDSNADYLTGCASFKLTTIDEEVRVLGPDLAVYSWIYRAEATLKTGKRDVFEKAGASFVFKRVDGEWKAVYYHESTLPPKSEGAS